MANRMVLLVPLLLEEMCFGKVGHCHLSSSAVGLRWEVAGISLSLERERERGGWAGRGGWCSGRWAKIPSYST